MVSRRQRRPSKYVAARLVAELADAWMAGAKAEALTPATRFASPSSSGDSVSLLTEDAIDFSP